MWGCINSEALLRSFSHFLAGRKLWERDDVKWGQSKRDVHDKSCFTRRNKDDQGKVRSWAK